MSLTRDSLEVRIAKLIVNTEFTLMQRIQREKWKEKKLYPMVEKMLANRGVLGLKAGETFDVVIENADRSTRKAKKRT